MKTMDGFFIKPIHFYGVESSTFVAIQSTFMEWSDPLFEWSSTAKTAPWRGRTHPGICIVGIFTSANKSRSPRNK